MIYYQILVAKLSQENPVFVLPNGHFKYIRVLYIPTNAPRVFQRIMNKIIKPYKFILAFLDNILIFSNDIKIHAEHVTIILNVWKENNIVEFNKSNFF